MATASSTQPAKLFARQLLRTNTHPRPNPSLFFLPGLNTRPFYETQHKDSFKEQRIQNQSIEVGQSEDKAHSNPEQFRFGFVKDFENNFSVVRDEYLALKKAYGDQDDYTKVQNEHTLNNGGWSWMSLVSKGKLINRDKFKHYCPITLQLFEESIPSSGHNLMTGTPFSYTFFSTMSPGTKIAPHYGATNLKLRCHFPLIVPPEAFLSVAGDARPWTEGKMTIFDDSYEHEACNLSEASERVLLLFDIWHPQIDSQEI